MICDGRASGVESELRAAILSVGVCESRLTAVVREEIKNDTVSLSESSSSFIASEAADNSIRIQNAVPVGVLAAIGECQQCQAVSSLGAVQSD